MRHRGEVTVFLTMILVSIMTLLLVVVESARETGARLYLRMAADSSMDSVMAQYHRGLWENYRILGLETGEKERLEQEFGDFFAPYAEAENWYPVTLVDTDRKDAVMLTEGQGAYFEQEILDYMKLCWIPKKEHPHEPPFLKIICFIHHPDSCQKQPSVFFVCLSTNRRKKTQVFHKTPLPFPPCRYNLPCRNPVVPF